MMVWFWVLGFGWQPPRFAVTEAQRYHLELRLRVAGEADWCQRRWSVSAFVPGVQLLVGASAERQQRWRSFKDEGGAGAANGTTSSSSSMAAAVRELQVCCSAVVPPPCCDKQPEVVDL